MGGLFGTDIATSTQLSQGDDYSYNELGDISGASGNINSFNLGEGWLNNMTMTWAGGDADTDNTVDDTNKSSTSNDYSTDYEKITSIDKKFGSTNTMRQSNSLDSGMGVSAGVAVGSGDASGGAVSMSKNKPTDNQPLTTSILGKGGTKDYNKLLVYGGLGLGGILVLKMMMKKG